MPEIDNADGAVSAVDQAEKRTEETHRFMRSVLQGDTPQVHAGGEDPNRAGRVPPGSDRQRPVSQAGDQSCQLLLMDQRVHGGWQSETDRIRHQQPEKTGVGQVTGQINGNPAPFVYFVGALSDPDRQLPGAVGVLSRIWDAHCRSLSSAFTEADGICQNSALGHNSFRESVKDSAQASRSVISTRQLPSIR